MEEIWKDIEGYEGLYQVSNLGKIKSLKGKREKILKGSPNPRGYLHVFLYKEKTVKVESIHKIVAETFIKKPRMEVNHKNGIKTDNRIENLEWCTTRENIEHAIRNNLITSEHLRGKPNINRKRVMQYELSGKEIKEWSSILEASNKLKISHSCIVECCKGKRNTAGGYIWKYVD